MAESGGLAIHVPSFHYDIEYLLPEAPYLEICFENLVEGHRLLRDRCAFGLPRASGDAAGSEGIGLQPGSARELGPLHAGTRIVSTSSPISPFLPTPAYLDLVSNTTRWANTGAASSFTSSGTT